MTERVTGTVQPRHTPRIPSEHSRHDRLLVARLAADDAYPDELEQARATVAACGECAALVADIRLLARATSQLPAPRRTRDFRLTQQQAEALRGSRVERLLRRMAAPGLAPIRPLAGVALSFGLVLAVVGAAMPQAMPASVPTDSQHVESRGLGPGAPAPAADPAPAAGEAPTGQPERASSGEGEPAALGEEQLHPVELDGARADEVDPLTVDAEDGTYSYNPAQAPASEAAGSLLLYAGLFLASISLAVLLAVWFARRRTRDPLLR